jgi:acetoin utilization deacetylase AcuC-like enzyme
MQKYAMLRERVGHARLSGDEPLLLPPAATDAELLHAHSAAYLERVKTGGLSPEEQRRIGFPWSPQMVERSRRSSGATLAACRAALKDGVAVNLAGGTHHAFRDRGEGYCVFNDAAVAVRNLQAQGLVKRAAVLDCDVHQGNGTASIFAGTRTASSLLPSVSSSTLPPPEGPPRSGRMRGAHAGDVFTISLHQHNNYPLWKPASSIDVDLPDGIGDDDYLAWLDNALSSGLRQFDPDLICYIAGADPYKEDQLGGLSLTIEGLKRRDELVFRVAQARGIPVMVTYAGGYAQNVEDTVTIHCNTVIAAREVFGGNRN